MRTPLRIQFVDGLVSQVSGSQLTVGDIKFDRSATEDEFLKEIPSLAIERGGPSKTYLRLSKAAFQLTIRIRPQFNWYLLRDEALSEKWIERYRNDSAH
jgi:hypothetical protein